jgi:hypothetical protein
MTTRKQQFGKSAVNKRVFIVGCSRSGTTLLQTLLASHENTITFPETQFFPSILRGRIPYRQALAHLGIATGKEVDYLKDMLRQFDREDLIPLLPDQSWRIERNIDAYVSLLDFMAAEQGKPIWIEKTPLNILWIDMIEEYVPASIIVHMIRDGRDVIASIVDRQRKNPDYFDGQDIEYGIKLWNQCLAETDKHIVKDNHLLVSYDGITKNPIRETNKIGLEIGLEYNEAMIENRGRAADRAILDSESWKSDVAKTIKKRSKYDMIFSDYEKHQIENQLNLKLYNKLCNEVYDNTE